MEDLFPEKAPFFNAWFERHAHWPGIGSGFPPIQWLDYDTCPTCMEAAVKPTVKAADLVQLIEDIEDTRSKRRRTWVENLFRYAGRPDQNLGHYEPGPARHRITIGSAANLIETMVTAPPEAKFPRRTFIDLGCGKATVCAKAMETELFSHVFGWEVDMIEYEWAVKNVQCSTNGNSVIDTPFSLVFGDAVSFSPRETFQEKASPLVHNLVYCFNKVRCVSLSQGG